MIKLNNKGFAISTMLYGITTIIIIVLMLILSIMRSSYNKENMATDQIYYYLNKCISKQVELENCYRDAASNNTTGCSEEYKRYTDCTRALTNHNPTEKYLNTTLIERAKIPNSDIINDPTIENRYVFIGENPANFIKIGNVTGRIVSLETNGKIKVLLQEKINTSFDISNNQTLKTEKDRWEKSIIYNSLNNKFKSLPQTSILTKGVVNLGIIYDTDTTEEALYKIKAISFNYNFGLLSLEDYLKASGDSSCKLNNSNIEGALTNCIKHNWMNNNNCTWTSTGYSGTNKYMTYSSAKPEPMDINTKCDAFMIIFLAPDTTISPMGDGSTSNPYIIE